MEWIALFSRLIIANIIFNLFFVRLMRRWAGKDSFEKAFFAAFVTGLIPTLVISDLLSRIPKIGPYLGFSVWAGLSPLFEDGPLGTAIAGAAVFFGLVLLVTYAYFRLVTRLVHLHRKHIFIRSLILLGAYLLATISVTTVLGWFKVPSPVEVGFASFWGSLAGPARTAVGQAASGVMSVVLRIVDGLVMLCFLIFVLGAVGYLFSPEPSSGNQATHGDILAVLLGISVAWCWLYAFPIRNLALHTGGALLAGFFFVPLGKALDRKQVRQRPARSVVILLILVALFAASVVLVFAWEFLHRNLLLALETWFLAPFTVYVQYVLWGGTALALLVHGIRLGKAMTARRRRQRRQRLRLGWVVLSLLALAAGVAAGLAVRRANQGIVVAVVAGCFVTETLYILLISPLLAPYRWAQMAVYVLPRVVLPPLLFVGVVTLLPDNLTWIAPATYGAVLVLELAYRWLLSRLAPVLWLKAQVARAKLWDNADRVQQRTQALRKALLKHWQGTLSQAESKRAAGRIPTARRQYNRIIAALGEAPRKSAEERQLLGRAYMGLGKLEWATDQQASLRAFRLAQELGVVDAEVYRLVAPNWARGNRVDDEAIEAYMNYVEAGLGRARPDDDAAVLGCLQAICRIEATTQGPPLAKAMQRNERVVRAADNVDWAHMHLGLGFLARGKPEEAVSHLERAQVLRPGWKEVFYHLGRAYLLDGRTDKALNVLRQARAALPDHAATAYLLGKVLLDELLAGDPEPDLERTLMRRRWAEAVQHLEAAVVAAARPIPAGYSFQLARAYALLPARREDAVRALREAVAADPTQKLYHWHLGLELKKLGRLDESKQAVAEALALDPAYAQAHALMGEVTLAQGEPAQARTHFEQALETLPLDEAIATGLGQALYHLGEYAEAVNLLSGIESATADGLFYLARAHAHLNQFDEAARCLTRRLEQFGEESDTRYYLGCARAHLEDYTEALADFDQALAHNPDRADAWVQRGYVLLQLGQEQEAHESYERALSADARYVEAYYAQGRVCQARKQWKEAMAHYAQAVAIAPAHAPSHRALGLIYEQREETEEAIAHYEAALAADEPWAWVHHRLGVHYCGQPGREVEAVRHMERARELGDDSDHLSFHLGLACLQQGAYARAAVEWETLIREHPDDVRLQTNLATTHYLWGCLEFDAGEHQQAIEHWEQFRAHFGKNRKIQVALAEAYFRGAVNEMQRGEQMAEARQALETAIELQGDGGLAKQRFYLGLAHLCLDGTEEPVNRAVELFGGIAETEPVYARSRYYQGLALWDRYLLRQEKGDLQQASALLQAATGDGSGPTPGLARMLLALTLTASKRHEEAAEELMAAWPTLANQDERVQASDAARLVAWNLVQARGREAAEATLSQIRSAHDHPALACCLAALAAEGGRLDEAVALLEEALGQSQDEATRDNLRQVLCHQAAVRGQDGDWLGAAESLRQAGNL
jgi:tetratricopeptide (TPR) repeat protein